LGGWGQKFRYRECSCPEGNSVFIRSINHLSISGGDASNPDCGCGPNEECETCKGEPKCEWTGWEPEGPCSTTCGGGVVPEQRFCKDKVSDSDCELPEDLEEGCPGEFKQATPCSIGKN